MEKKKVKIMLSAAAVMTAAGSGIFCAWKAGKKKKMAEVRADAPDLEEGLTEEKVRESLLRLFRLYADSEFDDLAEFLGDGSNPREYAAENYSGQLFLYLKRNMTDVMILEGDDGTGKEPFSMTDELFHYPACMISCQIEELLSDNFTLCLENEIWMLENGEFASVYCVRALLVDYPGCKVCGHRDLSPDLNGNGEIEPEEWVKQCPCFDVSKEKYSK